MNPLIQYWYYYLPDYVLSAVMWSMVARLLLSLVAPPNWKNYIWLAFVRITDPAIRIVRLLTPAVFPHPVVVIFSVFWIAILRFAYFIILRIYELAPTVSG